MLNKKISTWIKQDEEKIVELCSALVRCKTPSTIGDTRQAMQVVCDFLQKEGLDFELITKDERMPNLLASTKLKGPGRHLMFNGHLDVMPAGDENWSVSPFGGVIKQTKIWGRGVADMKAGLTASLFAYVYLSRLKKELGGKISLSVVSDEETGFERGTGHLFQTCPRQMKADCVLSGEPSGIDGISFASKGYLQFNVTINTRGAIAGYPNESQNAIAKAAELILALKEFEQTTDNLPPELQVKSEVYDRMRGKGATKILNRIVLDITKISAGSKIDVIPAKCEVRGVITFPYGTAPHNLIERLEKIVTDFGKLMIEGIASPDISSPDSEMVKLLQESAIESGAKKTLPVPEVALSDCRHFRHRQIPAYWYGPDGSTCSAGDENVSIAELLQVVRVQTLAGVKYLSKPKTKENSKIYHNNFKTKATIKTVPATRIAYLTKRAPSFAKKELMPVLDELFRQLDEKISPEEMTGVPYASYIACDGQVDVTVAYPITKNVVPKGVKVKDTLESRVAQIPHYGDKYATKAWAKLQRSIKDKGEQKVGEYREVYLINAPEPPENWLTLLQLPLR